EETQPTPEHRDQNWQKYHLLSYEEEQLANQVEEKLLQASIAPAQAETVDLKGFYKVDRQEQWKNSLVKEYGKMKDVLEEVTRGQLRERLGLPGGARLPREIPSKIVATLKPCDDAQVANEDGFAEKSRLCACGNFESGADNNGEPWTSSNIPPEAAFLNADISSGDPVIITPPKVMRDLGLVSEDTVWIARKNIYGLRRGPTEWETERDTKLNNATIEPTEGDKHSKLTFVPINLAAGLWKLVNERGEVVGACCCYVDDGLAVGDVEVIRRVMAFIQGLWAIKGQGILEKPGLGLDGDLVVSEALTLKLVQCVRFLGAEISVASDGLQIGQAKYVAQELRARGWLTLKGAESLPVPSEGLSGPEIRDHTFDHNVKLAQKEAGTLMRIALRSRPDISACLGIASTLITSRPAESLRMCKGIWRYLRNTWDKLLHYRYGGEPENPGANEVGAERSFRIVSDASLAPGGARSRSGIALFLGEHLLLWKSQRQSIVAWSATESEIEATTGAMQEGIKLHAVIEELLGSKIRVVANGDNSGAIHLVTRQALSHSGNENKAFCH
ncbi:RE1, partial [Symbiodinium sp. CCMP2456]